jgi:hypothetical protein
VQGRTVDTAHALVNATTSRELLYVSATRGRMSNRLYVDTRYDPDPTTGHDRVLEARTARDVLAGVLANEAAEISAHETMRRAQHDAESWTTLHAQYETIAQAAQTERWDTLIGKCGLTPNQIQGIRASDAYGPLLAALRDADSRGLAVETVFPRLVQARTLSDAEDVASVLHGRVSRWIQASRPVAANAGGLIAGLVPRAGHVPDPDMDRALQERERSMLERARTLTDEAISTGAAWLGSLGPIPTEAGLRSRWLREASTVSAYRDRWNVGHDLRPLGPQATSFEQLDQRRRAWAAITRAQTLSRCGGLGPPPRTLTRVVNPAADPIGRIDL